jgi:hypothetical protein
VRWTDRTTLAIVSIATWEEPVHRYVSLLTRRWKTLLLVLSAAVAVVALAAPSAGAYIYVSGPFTSPWGPSMIQRLTLDGSGVQPDFINGPRVGPDQLHVYGDRLYWLDSSAGDCLVKSAALDGTDIQTLASLYSQHRCGDISTVVASGYLYWVGPGTIGRLSVDPPYSAQPDFIHVPGTAVESLVTDGEWLYWIGSDGVGRARLDGTDIDPAVLELPQDGVLLGVEHGYLYWRSGLVGEAGVIGREQLDGSDFDSHFLTGVAAYDGALTSQWLYYTASMCGAGCIDVDGSVSRVALEPGATPQPLASLGPGVGYAIAVDSLGDPFPAVRIKKHRDGTATALLSTSGAEKLSVRGKRIVHTRAKQLRAKVAGVAIRPRRGARRELRHRGAARVTVRLVYRANSGMPQFWKRDLMLRLGRR